MPHQNVIILEKCPATYEVWGSLKKACEAHGLSYHSIKMLKMPFTHKDWVIRRVKFNSTDRTI